MPLPRPILPPTGPFAPPRFVAYYRVSTDKQGRSGLGLEAQTIAVESYVHRCGGEIIAHHQEVESGKHADRPELIRAMELCRRKKAVLIIAKLDLRQPRQVYQSQVERLQVVCMLLGPDFWR